MKRIAGRVPVGIEEPLGGQLRRGFKDFSRGRSLEIEYDGGDDVENVSLPDVNLYTSQVRWDPSGEKHMIALDVDVPVQVFPSRTPGHSHLYIEKAVSQTDLLRLAWLLAEMGIVEEGYANASAERGFTVLRAPWMPKRRLVRVPRKIREREVLEAAESEQTYADFAAEIRKIENEMGAHVKA